MFEEQYVKSLTSGKCDDLLACWRSVRDRLPIILKKLEQDLPLSAGAALRRLEKALKQQILSMKADVAE